MVGAVLWVGCFVDNDSVAARGLQPEHGPVVHDPIVGAGQKKGSHIGRAARLRRWNEGAEQYPFAMIAAAGESPAAGESEAAFDDFDRADGLIGRRYDRGIVAVPHVPLCASVEQRKLEWMHAQHTIDPGSGPAAFGQRHLNVDEDLRVELEAAVTLWLQHPEE